MLGGLEAHSTGKMVQGGANLQLKWAQGGSIFRGAYFHMTPVLHPQRKINYATNSTGWAELWA